MEQEDLGYFKYQDQIDGRDKTPDKKHLTLISGGTH